ncbi:MAG: hypothetical protein R3B48_23300 [Kofleriaceae bacterium]
MESKFVEMVRDWLVSLPHDLKIAFDAMDDENLPRNAREVAVGTIIYIMSPNDLVSDRNDTVVSYADDAVLLRLGLLQVVKLGGEDGEAFRERYSELFDGVQDQLELCDTVMGDLMPWLSSKIELLRNLDYKGKKVKAYLDDDDARGQLFDDGLVFRTDYPVDEETIGDKLKKASTITDGMQRRKLEEARTKGQQAS